MDTFSPSSKKKMETPEYSVAIQALMDQDVSTQQEILDLFIAKKISPQDFLSRQEQRTAEFKTKHSAILKRI